MYASVAARLCALYAAGAMLSGCLFTDRLLLAYIDSDSDGYFEDGFPGSRTWDEGTDCNDNDPAINGGQPELCGDGIDNDCNGEIDESGVGDIVVYADVDKDGFGNPNNNKEACTPDADWVTNDDDCDDQNNIINPLMEEACDGLDNDCDKIVDDNAPQTPWYEDLDGDSFGTPARVELSCQPPSGFVPNPDDCDDANASVFPGADDVPYDGVDADCATDSDYDLDRDGYLHAASGTAAPDCDDDDASIHPGSAEVWYDSVDQDCDPLTEWDQDRDGFEVIPHGADCDDLNPLRRPGAPETWYDGIDQDCDPATEWDQDGDGLTVVTAPVGGADDCDDRTPAVLGPSLWYPDVDQDGWGDPLRYVTACAQPVGHVAQPDDCDDTVSTIHPEAPETCAPGDEDCDGLTDEDGGNLWYLDNDGDGFGDARFRGIETCHPPANTAERGEDCDDTRPEVHPGATEVCNGLDDDCDREFDRVAGRDLRRDLWPDLDGDGVGAITDPVHDCREQLTDHVTRTGDCDDARDVVFPGAAEVCDGVDNNCDDGISDEGRVHRWFDGDGDGFGVGASDWDCPTTFDTSWVPQGGDCDDGAAAIHPDAVEVCDHLDNDCDQLYDIEGGHSLYVPRYVDGDGDGWGAGGVVQACAEEPGFTQDSGDCADDDADRFPGNPERCDEVDQDCDGLVADDGRRRWYLDGDGDGAGSALPPTGWLEAYPYEVCEGLLPEGLPWTDAGGDCADANPAVHPRAPEVCDNLDNNCNGMDDELPLRVEHWVDQDGDRVGGLPAPQPACDLPGDELVRTFGDCDDDDRDRFPGNPERCDEVDQDCDDEVADDGRQPWYLDEDRDGAGSEDVPTDWSQRTGGAPYPAVVCATQLSPLFHWEAVGGDCDDADPTRRPGAAEICDYIDSNCNGWADERTTPHFPDDDGDGTGAQGAASAQRCPNTAGWVENQLDCDDTNEDRFIGNPERCDEVDQDCDGDVRDDGRRVWWYDGDGDGYGATYAGQSPRDVCDSLLSNPTRWVTRGQDCDDVNPAVSPGQPEVCDGTDNDCNTATAEPYAAHYPDVDRDGYGDLDARNPTMRCRVSGDAWVEDHTDCDDSLVNINPRAADPCDDVDQDCDGDPWEGQDVNAVVDWDHDGYGEAGVRPTTVCRPELCPLVDPIGGTVDDAGRDDVDPLTGDYLEPCWAAWTADVADDDCDDEDHATHPNAVEVCDGKRNTCDECTHIDDGSACPDTYRFEWWGSVYLVRTDTDPSPTRTSVIETWQSAADWCRSHGYKLWWPDQDAWFFTGLFPEPRSLAVIDELFWQSTTYYHTGLRGTCPNDPAQTIGWMLWDPLTDECTPFSSDTMRLLGLSAAYSVDSVARVSLYNIQNFPYANAESRNINDLGRTVCELDDGDLLDSNYILPEDNPRCP